MLVAPSSVRVFTCGCLIAGFAIAAPQEPPRPIRALIVSGANNHDWRWTSPEIARTLAETGRFTVEVTYEPEKVLPEVPAMHAAGKLDVIVLDYNRRKRWPEAAEQGFLAAVRAGCGVSVLHAANNAFPGWTDYERMVGLLWRKGTGHGRYHAFDVHVIDRYHPITDGMADLRMHPDELYHRLVLGEGAEFRVLMSAYSAPKTGGTGRHEPMLMVSREGKGRVFHTPLGHVWKNNIPSRASWADPQLRRLVARGTEWAATGAVTLSPTPLNRLSEAETKAGFVSLFDGRQIEHWRAYRAEGLPEQGWTVRDAAIVHEARGGGGDLVTREEFANFDFRFSFRVAPKANSGVIWHVTEDNEQTYMSGPEYQVLDDAGHPGVNPKHSVGALYGLEPVNDKPVRPAGAWNEGRIVIAEGRVQHWLNGKKLVDVACTGDEWTARIAKSKFKNWPFGTAGKGRLALQDHGDEVAYRNLRIRRL
ncbi:MAG: DUF1080 domain-containing protein [bacterium]|nr:DUF1080 domain-containing protein [bacterium]